MKHRIWLGCLNNPESATESFLAAFYVQSKAKYICGQLEKAPTTGTLHIQYVVYLGRQARLAEMKKLCSKSRFDPVVQDNGSDRYCMKEESRIEGPFEFGIKPVRRNSGKDWNEVWDLAKAGKLDSIDAQIRVQAYSHLKKIEKDHLVFPPPLPENRGVWIVGPAGIGKTVYADQLYPNAYRKLANKWWDGYSNVDHKYAIMDDLHKDMCDAEMTTNLKLWGDKPAFMAETKGGGIVPYCQKFIVTSQYTMAECFPDDKSLAAIERRYQSIELVPKKGSYFVPETPKEMRYQVEIGELGKRLITEL